MRSRKRYGKDTLTLPHWPLKMAAKRHWSMDKLQTYLLRHYGLAPCERTIRRHMAILGLRLAPYAQAQAPSERTQLRKAMDRAESLLLERERIVRKAQSLDVMAVRLLRQKYAIRLPLVEAHLHKLKQRLWPDQYRPEDFPTVFRRAA